MCKTACCETCDSTTFLGRVWMGESRSRGAVEIFHSKGTCLLSRFYRVSALKNKNFTEHQWKCQDMNVIYSMIFWGNFTCLPRSILKQKAQNVRIAPTNQIFHTFTDKKIFFWNSHQVLIHFKVYRKFSFTQTKNFANSLTFGRFCFSDNIYQVEHLSRSDFF